MTASTISTPHTSASRPGTGAAPPTGFRERRRERRRLAELDRLGARRAELRLLHDLLTEASDLVATGWTQRCWFVAADDDGVARRIGTRNLGELAGQQVTRVCLVGAIVQSAGGVQQAGTQPVHRALDVTWATLFHQSVRWCPPPAVRLAHVHDLTRWNDDPHRTADDVADLLALAGERAHRTDVPAAPPARW